MPIQTFGVDADSVRRRYFPQLSALNTTSKPTLATVTEAVTDSAADLGSKLSAKGLSATDIAANAGATYPNAYAWCAKTVRLATLVEILPGMQQLDPEVAKRWRAELKERYTDLDERGAAALGDAPSPTNNGTGPISHISAHSLDTGDTDLISDVIPPFRKNDRM